MSTTTQTAQVINRRMSRQSIQTKYHGPTDRAGARISAACEAGRIIQPLDHSLGIEERHAKVAMALADKLEWGGEWVQGSVPALSAGYVFVMVEREV